MSSNSCGCGVLEVEPKDFEGQPPDVAAEMALGALPGLFFEKRDFSRIVKILAVMSMPVEKIVLTLKQNEDKMMDLGCEVTEGLKTTRGEKINRLLAAIKGSCSHELSNGVWTYDSKVQKMLLGFAQKSEDGLEYWKEVIVKDFKTSELMKDLCNWNKYLDRIKICMEIFGLQKDRLLSLAEQLIMYKIKNYSVDNWSSSSTLEIIKNIVRGLEVPDKNICESINAKLDSEINSNTVECIRVLKGLDIPIDSWQDKILQAADGLILAANIKEEVYDRIDMVKKAYLIHKSLENNFDIKTVRGKAIIEAWEKESESVKSAKSVLRKVARSNLIKGFKYNPRGIRDSVWAKWNGVI